MPGKSTRWRSADPQQLAWASWDGGHAVYHRPSGKTHFVNAATALLLERILIHPTGLEAACVALAGSQHGADAGIDDRFMRDVVATLLRLEELGLVVRA